MTQFSTLLGYGSGSLLGVIAIGWILYSFYDLFRYLCFLVFRIKRSGKPKSSFKIDILKYLAIGLPIMAVPTIIAQYSDDTLNTIMAFLTVLWYVVAYMLLNKLTTMKSNNEPFTN